MNNLHRLIQDAKAAGCPMGQVRNFLSAGYVPQPKQLQFHALCRAADLVDGPREIGFGGARGPGKSHAMFAQMALDDCQRVPGLRALMVRKVLKAGTRSFEVLREKILGSRVSHHYRRVGKEIQFPNGSSMVLDHFKDDRSFENLIGSGYELIGLEEATTLEADKYPQLRTCCRSTRTDWRPRVYSNANPGGIGHQWYKRLFITGRSPEVAFVPATFRDNRFLNKGYRKFLEGLPHGWRRRAWLDGDWDIAAGQYFTNWNPEVHVVEPFTWQSNEMRFCLAMDTGFQHPTVVVLLAVDGQDRVYVVAEYGAAHRVPEQHSREIDAMLGRVGVTRGEIRSMVVGADAYRTLARDTTTASLYQDLGWSFEAARMDRLVGAQTTLQYLGDTEAGVAPRLFIFNTCHNVIRQLPEMQHDPKKTEDVLKVNVDAEGYGGDDYYDALRYGLMEIAEGSGTAQYATLSIPPWR